MKTLFSDRMKSAALLTFSIICLAVSMAWAGFSGSAGRGSRGKEGHYEKMFANDIFISGLNGQIKLYRTNPPAQGTLLGDYADPDGSIPNFDYQDGRYVPYRRIADSCETITDPNFKGICYDTTVPSPFSDQHQSHLYPFWGSTDILRDPLRVACTSIQAHMDTCYPAYPCYPPPAP